MANIPLLVSQVTSILTSLAGMVALFYIFRSLTHLAHDRFRKGIILTFIFTTLALAGIISMTVFHTTQEIREITSAENIWYLFMFAAFLFYCFESLYIASLGKDLQRVSITRER